MKYLLLDTTLTRCTVAIAADGRILAAGPADAGGRGHAEHLLPAIEAVRREAGLALADLGGLIACTGPGSFTGIRTGLSVARGLSLALGIPLWGVPTTAALALPAALPGRATVAVIDAYRGEVYLQAFAADDPLRPLGPAMLSAVAGVPPLLPPGPLTLVGSGARLLPRAADRLLSDQPENPTAAAMLRLGQIAAAGWAPGQPLPPAPSPVYIRPADAVLPGRVQPEARLSVAISLAGHEELEVLAGLHGEAFAEGWDAATLSDLLAMPGAMALLARDPDGQPAGFLLGRQAAGEAEIITLAVRPRLRRLKVGHALVQAFHRVLSARKATESFLEVAAGNRPAQLLYAGLGYREVGRRKDYYTNTNKSPDGVLGAQDAIVMRAVILDDSPEFT